MKLLLDTSFLINCVKFKLDFIKQLSNYELFLIASVVDELNELADGNSKDAKNASVVLALTKGVKVINEPDDTAGDADASLFELSRKGYAVATQDAELKKKIKVAGGSVAFIRQRKTVVVE